MRLPLPLLLSLFPFLFSSSNNLFRRLFSNISLLYCCLSFPGFVFVLQPRKNPLPSIPETSSPRPHKKSDANDDEPSPKKDKRRTDVKSAPLVVLLTLVNDQAAPLVTPETLVPTGQERLLLVLITTYDYY